MVDNSNPDHNLGDNPASALLERKKTETEKVLGPLELLMLEEERKEAQEKKVLRDEAERAAFKRRSEKAGLSVERPRDSPRGEGRGRGGGGRGKPPRAKKGHTKTNSMGSGYGSGDGSRSGGSSRAGSPAPGVPHDDSRQVRSKKGSSEGGILAQRPPGPIPARTQTPIIRWKRSVPVKLVLDLPPEFGTHPWLAHIDDFLAPGNGGLSGGGGGGGGDDGDGGLPYIRGAASKDTTGGNTKSKNGGTGGSGRGVQQKKSYGAWYIPPAEWKKPGSKLRGADDIPDSIPGTSGSKEREEWRDMPEKFKTKAQKEEERLEREHAAKLKELKKELGEGVCAVSTRAFREFLLEKGGRLPHYLLNLDENEKSSASSPTALLKNARGVGGRGGGVGGRASTRSVAR